MRQLIAGAALVVMVGCTPLPKFTAAEAEAKAGPRPTQEQAEALAKGWCQTNLMDPTSFLIKNVQVLGPGWSEAMWRDESKRRYGWLVSFDVNGKNAYGGFVGFDRKRVLVRDGAIIPTVLAEPVPTH